jgi:hypothetical protein
MSLLDTLIEADLFLPSIQVAGEPRREVWICHRTDGGSQTAFGSGTLDDPFDGSTAAKVDFIMANRILPGTTVRFGPGTFETHGGVLVAGWFAKNGRIVGSGMFVTTLKLIEVDDIAVPRAIVYHGGGALTNFEISDLTLDANIDGQPNSSKPGGGTFDYPRVCVNGINLAGENIQVRRVRIINAGTHQPGYEYPTTVGVANECFALWIYPTGRAISLKIASLKNSVKTMPKRSRV